MLQIERGSIVYTLESQQSNFIYSIRALIGRKCAFFKSGVMWFLLLELNPNLKLTAKHFELVEVWI